MHEPKQADTAKQPSVYQQEYPPFPGPITVSTNVGHGDRRYQSVNRVKRAKAGDRIRHTGSLLKLSISFGI